VVYSVWYLAFSILAHKDTVDWSHYGGLYRLKNFSKFLIFHWKRKIKPTTNWIKITVWN